MVQNAKFLENNFFCSVILFRINQGKANLHCYLSKESTRLIVNLEQTTYHIQHNSKQCTNALSLLDNTQACLIVLPNEKRTLLKILVFHSLSFEFCSHVCTKKHISTCTLFHPFYILSTEFVKAIEYKFYVWNNISDSTTIWYYKNISLPKYMVVGLVLFCRLHLQSIVYNLITL